MGRRDNAILLFLARLGLRGGEVIRLNLEDIDWRAGKLLIDGKGNPIDRLPLLEDVGNRANLTARYAGTDCPSC